MSLVKYWRYYFTVEMTTIILQTVILDSCHSVSATRGDWDGVSEGEGQIRGLDLPSDYLLEEDLCTDGDRDIVDAMGRENSGLSSHVLFAAASSGEKAREMDERGVFTKALLTLLRTESLAKLTYLDVVQRLVDLPG
jgi:hypothetical protein